MKGVSGLFFSSVNTSFWEVIEKLSEILIDQITPVGKEIKKLLDDKSHLLNVLKKGTEKANNIAEENLKNIREKVGLI